MTMVYRWLKLRCPAIHVHVFKGMVFDFWPLSVIHTLTAFKGNHPTVNRWLPLSTIYYVYLSEFIKRYTLYRNFKCILTIWPLRWVKSSWKSLVRAWKGQILLITGYTQEVLGNSKRFVMKWTTFKSTEIMKLQSLNYLWGS